MAINYSSSSVMGGLRAGEFNMEQVQEVLMKKCQETIERDPIFILNNLTQPRVFNDIIEYLKANSSQTRVYTQLPT